MWPSEKSQNVELPCGPKVAIYSISLRRSWITSIRIWQLWLGHSHSQLYLTQSKNGHFIKVVGLSPHLMVFWYQAMALTEGCLSAFQVPSNTSYPGYHQINHLPLPWLSKTFPEIYPFLRAQSKGKRQQLSLGSLAVFLPITPGF